MRFPRALLAIALAAPLCSCTGPTPEQQHAHNEKHLAAEGLEALSLGAAAPPLSLSGPGGARLSLPLASPPPDPLAGYTALYFFPAPKTPNSAKHLSQLAAQQQDLAADGIAVFGITHAQTAELEAFAAGLKACVPLLADPDGRVCESYGTLLPGGRFAQRTTVLVAPDGKLALYKRGLVLAPELRKAAGRGAHVKAEPATP